MTAKTDAALRIVLLVGGSGTRLWPLSREQYPKQFLPLLGDQSPLQATWSRASILSDLPPVVVANEEHRFLVAEQLRVAGCPQNAPLILEPAGRNTAPAIALAALEALQDDEDAVLLVLPSDHAVNDVAAFTQAVRDALPAAQAGKLVVFGVVPEYPETGYGYIHAPAASQGHVAAVEAFVEKPDAERAQAYLEQGNYYWNSGMFLFRASAYLRELERFRPDILATCRAAMKQARRDGDFVRADAAAFAAVPAESIDYAVMEQTADAVMIPLDSGWSDIGSWDALWRITPHDENGNAVHGDALLQDCRNVLAYGSKRMLAVLGVEDLVVVETADAVLVAAKDQVQHVRRLVTELKNRKRSEVATHKQVFRPWGNYESIDSGPRFQVKRITVQPGGRLSLQMHHHRAEHWVVVKGTARVTRGDESFLLTEDQSTYIPLGVSHRLENPGAIPLELVEVQSGSYLGEDDIVRFDDVYGRQEGKS